MQAPGGATSIFRCPRCSTTLHSGGHARFMCPRCGQVLITPGGGPGPAPAAASAGLAAQPVIPELLIEGPDPDAPLMVVERESPLPRRPSAANSDSFARPPPTAPHGGAGGGASAPPHMWMGGPYSQQSLPVAPPPLAPGAYASQPAAAAGAFVMMCGQCRSMLSGASLLFACRGYGDAGRHALPVRPCRLACLPACPSSRPRPSAPSAPPPRDSSRWSLPRAVRQLPMRAGGPAARLNGPIPPHG